MEKSDFMNYRALRREIQQIRMQLEALEASLYSPRGQRFTSTPRASSGPKKTMEDAVAGRMRLEELYWAKLREQEELLLRLEVAIQSLGDPSERLIMRARYLEGRSWVTVIREMQKLGYSERSVYRLHGTALLKLKEV